MGFQHRDWYNQIVTYYFKKVKDRQPWKRNSSTKLSAYENISFKNCVGTF